VRVLSAHTKPVNCVAFSPDGARLAEASDLVRIWDVPAGTVDLARWVKRASGKVRVAFSPDGTKLAAAGGVAMLIDLAGDGQTRLKGGTGFYDISFSPDGRRLVGSGDTFCQWDAKTGEALPEVPLPAAKGFRVLNWPGAAYSKDGKRLAVSRRVSRVVGEYWRNTDQVFVIDLAANAVVMQAEWTGHPAARLAFSPDGALLAGACGPVLRMWDAGSGEPVAERQVGKLHFLGMAFSPDGRYVGTVSKDRTTRLWEVGARGDPKTYEWDAGKLLDIAFSPDGHTAALASDEGKVVLFDVD
jgi:WD40 repeat protein